QLDRFFMADVPGHHWEPVAIASAVLFYLNRAVTKEEIWYGYAGAAMVALLAGFHAPHGDRGLAWMLLAIVPFLIGWRARLADFRIQGYALAALGLGGMAITPTEPVWSLAIAAVLTYALAMCPLPESESEIA